MFCVDADGSAAVVMEVNVAEYGRGVAGRSEDTGEIAPGGLKSGV